MNNNYYGSIERSDATADLEEAQQSLLGMNVKNNDEGAESRQLSYSRCVYALLIFIMTVASIPAWTTSDERDYLFHNEYSLLQSSVTFAADEGTEIPFPHVDRSQFGKKPVPASSIVDPQLFSSSLRGHGENSSSLLKVPFPTGAFWTNLVMEPTADLLLSYPIIAYPYGFKWNPNMLQVSLPSLRRLMDSVSIRDIFNADLTLSSMENVSQRFIQYFDPLSVTLRFQSSDDILWETFIVQGSPYVTARYENMTPKIQALSIFQGISCLRNNYCTNLSHENERVSFRSLLLVLFYTLYISYILYKDGGYNTKQLQGTRFAIQTKENLTWLLFTSVPVTLVFDKISRTTILFKEEFSGILRLALIPPVQDELIEFTNKFPQTYENNFDPFSTGISKLIDHSNVYPVGSEISWSFPSDNIGNLLFQYKTKSMTDSSGEKKDEDLLMLALPHHIDVLSSRTSKLMSADDFDLVYNTIKGYMTAVIGSVWSLNEELTSIGFDNDIALEQVSKLSKKTKITILDQVTLDAKVVLPTMDENIYGYGKQVSRLAQLIHISNVLLQGDESLSNKYESVVQAAQDKLHNFLTAFLSGKTIDSLVYDVNFGGLVTKDGLDDFMNDFGNGW
jgi:endoglucanase Acf2